eukprot:TRINITY_DN3013_c0_g1_i2.p1 TRINITY_DN3013_c0_g1~~TRINITY_DN3013_c0_g1_i2.p1  ORF type:complete len:381 (-),score=48.39 TRINITY_DN3013_c0_g1_i2:293-1435(-)
MDQDYNPDEGEGYSWEKDYDKTWEKLPEDEVSIENANRRAKRARQEQKRAQLETRAIRRGMHRHVFLIVDFSRAMNDKDLKPTRLSVTLNLIDAFIREYFDQNPLSQLGLISTSASKAERITELSGNPTRHVTALRKAATTSGEPSLQNALEMALSTLIHVPKHGSREIVVIFASLTTCDPGDIYTTIENLKKENIRASVVGLSAELRVCRALTEQTNGLFSVALNEDHFREVLFEHVQPPPTTTKIEASLVHMGFPSQLEKNELSICICHKKLKYGGYSCPRCNNKVCELPQTCNGCGLTLVSSPHLARSYHHLFPILNFDEIPSADEKCYGCQLSGAGLSGSLYMCKLCKKAFCYDCDNYIHESLHTCPGCENTTTTR